MNSLPAGAPDEGASPPERGSATPPPRQRFAVAPDAYRLGRARRRVRDYLTLSCDDGACIDDVVLCVHEACANAVRHSGSRADIEVFLGFQARDLRVVVRDRGHGFDTSRFDRRALPELLSERGWGLFLMSRLSDEIELRSDGGLEVRLVKRDVLRVADDDGAAAAGEPAAPAPARAVSEPARARRDELRLAAERDELRIAAEHDELRAALATAEARFAALVDGLAEGVAVHELVERDGEVVDYRTLQVNAAFERQSGLSAEQVCGRSAGELSASGRAPRLDEYAWVVASGEPFDFETWVEETQCHLTVRAVALGGARFATVSGDVTERRRADADLRRAGELARAPPRRAASACRGTIRVAAGARAARPRSSARDDRAQAADEALRARGDDLDSRERALRAADEALQARSAAAPPAEERRGGGEADQLAERIELGEELDAVNRLLRADLGLDEMMQQVLDAGVAALAADAGTVELREGEAWVVRSQSGIGPELVGVRQDPQQTPNALRALNYREPFATADMPAARSAVGFVAEHGLRAVLAVPLVVRDEVIGCLSFYGRQVRVFDDPEIDFGRRLGATAALAIGSARLRDEPRDS